MGRHKSFDQELVLTQMREVFLTRGYEGSSIDDLVTATGLLRGSLYSAFASKRGMFLAVLKASLTPGEMPDQQTLNLLMVAMMELCASDSEMAALVSSYLDSLPLADPVGSPERSAAIASLLGTELLRRAHLKQ